MCMSMDGELEDESRVQRRISRSMCHTDASQACMLKARKIFSSSIHIRL